MLARGVRNVIYNYTDAQRKVRSATSNDAWGPSPALMHEIADLTDNIVAYAEIMPIIWKRLNDHGKNWRHVYKSLVLLDHLIKFGNERVSQQCKENIFAIQTLKDFQYVEDQKDQGYNVREKAKQLVALLKDDERLRNERRKAQEARERYSRQAMGMDSTGAVTYGRTTSSTSVRRNSAEGADAFSSASTYLSGSNTFSSNSNNRSSSFNENLHSATSKDFVQPSNQEEEQLQMQIALAESQREAEADERRRRNDDLKLRIALERSINETSPDPQSSKPLFDQSSSLFDNLSKNDPFQPATTIGWNVSNNRPSTHLGFTTQTQSDDPWSSGTNGRSSTNPPTTDPWQLTGIGSGATTQQQTTADHWSESHSKANGNGLSINLNDPWGMNTNQNGSNGNNKTVDNELSEFFGASAHISTSNDTLSSNPWNVTSNPSSIPLPTIVAQTVLNPKSASPANSSNGTTNNNSSYIGSITSRKTPESFLGEQFSTLVDFDHLVPPTKGTNPFGSNTTARAPNPFANATKPPTLEQLSTSSNNGFTSTSTLPPPLIPSSYNGNNTAATTSSLNTNNPFL